jgi:transcriptional regulator with XRE-family HTH domain
MPTHESARQRGARLARDLLRRIGEELRLARMAAGLSSRTLGSMVGISHTQVIRIERGVAPHVDIEVLGRMASVLGYAFSIRIHPVATPVRDAGHIALLARLRERVHPAVRWRSEVPMPIPGDLRSADATLDGDLLDAMVEAETRLGDIQGVERRIASKARDLGVERVILLVLDSRHNREVVRSTPWLAERFPVSTRPALAALSRAEDPGGDCLIFL